MRNWIDLIESLSKPSPWIWISQEKDYAKAEFECGPSKFGVSFSGEGSVGLTFWNESTDGDGIGIVGGQDARGVFATMAAIITDFAEKYQPEKLHWSARPNELSRQRLYDRLCQTLSLPGYRFEHGGERKLIYRLIKNSY